MHYYGTRCYKSKSFAVKIFKSNYSYFKFLVWASEWFDPAAGSLLVVLFTGRFCECLQDCQGHVYFRRYNFCSTTPSETAEFIASCMFKGGIILFMQYLPLEDYKGQQLIFFITLNLHNTSAGEIHLINYSLTNVKLRQAGQCATCLHQIATK